jgi:hypothetical protein
MSSSSNPPPPALTTIDALLSLADFIGSPANIARVKELQRAEAAAKNAKDNADKAATRAQGMLDEHAAKVEAHNTAAAQLQSDQAELKRQQDLLARKLAKMKEAESL